MRRSLLASTALTTSTTLITSAAWAANLPVKAPPPPAAPPFSWTGCYVGANVGGASTLIDHSFTVPSFFSGIPRPESTFSDSGREGSFTGGGQIGCNWQFDPKWVLGLKGDINYLRATRGQTFSFAHFNDEDTVASLGTSLHWLGTIRALFGYAWERSLLYATGGLAFGRVTSSVGGTVDNDISGLFFPIYSGSYSATRTGWAVGGGYAYAFTDRLSGTLEYLHFDLGTASYNVVKISGATDDLPTTWSAAAKVSGDIFRVGLNWKFTP